MRRLSLVVLISLLIGFGVAACESREGGGFYVEGTGGVNVGN